MSALIGDFRVTIPACPVSQSHGPMIPLNQSGSWKWRAKSKRMSRRKDDVHSIAPLKE